MSRRRQLLCLSLAAAVLSALAGCGAAANPLDAVRTAATNTLALTAQSTLKLTSPRLFGDTPTVVGRGEFSFPKGLGYEGLQLPAHGRRAAGTAYLVFVPARVWIRPVSSAALPDGDLWISTKLTDPQSGGAPTQALALVLEAVNPQLLLEEIATGAATAARSGHRVVDHVPYTDYDVSVDVARALDARSTTGPLRTAMRQQLAALRAAGLGSRIQVAASVDGAERLAQLQFSLPGAQLGTIQIELWKFGSPIPLSLPLASQTVDIASLRLTPEAVAPDRMLRGE